MLLILPILTFVVYIYSVITLLKNKCEHTKMYIFLVTAPFIFSLAETAVIYHFHEYQITNLLLFILITLIDVLVCLFKGILFNKKKDEALKSTTIFDLLCVVGLILTIIFFR